MLEWSDAELWLVGQISADIRPVLREYAELPGVRYVGHVAEPSDLYQQASVFVFPTLEEGSALVTYEALACGLPVITTLNAGSIVRDGVEGIIVPIRDVDGLATAMGRLCGDDDLRKEMGLEARRRAETFTWKRYGDSLVDRYRELVSGGISAT